MQRLVRTLLPLLLLTAIAQAQDKMEVKDADSNVLMKVEDEGTAGSLTLMGLGAAPSSFTNKLYNIGGSLYWNGAQLLTSGGATGWSLTGNAGTVDGTNFIGTTDNVPLNFRVNNVRGLRLEYAELGPGTSSPNVIGGFSGNTVSPGIIGATIGGGGLSGNVNTITGTSHLATIGGGAGNSVSNISATIAGGNDNTASGESAAVSGGEDNIASGNFAFVGGGRRNEASNIEATVSGGNDNKASGDGSTVIGGLDNIASGLRSVVAGGSFNSAAASNSFAGGELAKANHRGTFVWSDDKTSVAADSFYSTANYQFLIRADGGVGINKNNPATALDVNGTVTANKFVGDGSELTGIAAPGDDLGNHTATQTLDLAANDITNGGTVTAAAFVGDGSGLTGIAASGDDLGDHTATQALDLAANDITNGGTVTAAAFVGDGSGLTNLPPGNGWSLTGNAGTDTTVNFIGTTDDMPLDFRVNNVRFLRLEYAGAGSSIQPNVIGGAPQNNVSSGSYNATISGGFTNSVTGSGGTISGGASNTADINANVGGGTFNTANGLFSAVGGGNQNVASGQYSVAPGGVLNEAGGDFSFAAGNRAQANHKGAFVWADGTNTAFTSTAANQFLVRAGNGVGINKNNPATALDVNGTVTATAFVGDGSGLTGITAPGDDLGNHTATQTLDLNTNDITNGGTVTAAAFVGDGSGLTGISGDDLGNHTAAQALNLNGNYLSGDGDSEGVFVDNSGNVGIGTTTPVAPLTILGNGATKVVGITQNQVGGISTMELTTNDQSNNQATRLLFRGNLNNADTEFYTGARGSESMTMTIKGSGNVGIGTTTPTSRLDVSGTVTATAFVGDGSALTGIAGDNLGNHTVTQTLNLNGNRLSGDGDNEGVFVDGTGKVAVGSFSSSPAADLHVFGAGSVVQALSSSGLNANAEFMLSENTGVSQGMVLRYNGAADRFDILGKNGSESGPHLSIERDSGRIGVGTAAPTNAFSVAGSADFTGNVGIGVNNPTEKLHVNGNALADAHTTPSSRRWKTNIQTINNALETVQQLRGVTYDWKETGKHDIGLIAEEVGAVIPEIVAYEENGVDAKSVDYPRLVAVLIEAVKELKQENDTLKTQNDSLTKEVASLNGLQAKVAQIEVALRQMNANSTVKLTTQTIDE